MNDKIYIGKLGKTVGLKGNIKVYLDTDFPEQFKKGVVFTTNRKLSLTVESYNTASDVAKFVGFDNVDEVKKLTNQELYTTIEDTRENCKLEENEYFWFDLIGCEVLENDLKLGTVSDIQRLPSCDYFLINTDEELVSKELPKTFLIPKIDMYIESIDIENKIIKSKDSLAILENS